MDTLTIDEELQRIIPPLTEDEYKGLESSILSEGVRDPIIVWSGHNVIVDGHNRYRICQEHDIPFGIFEKEFADKQEVIRWMRDNQLSRRNLTPGQKAALEIDVSEAIMREEAKAKKAEAGRSTHGNQYTKSAAPDQLVGSCIQTAEPSTADITSNSECTTKQPEATENTDSVVHETSESTKDVRQKSPYEADVPITVVHEPEKSRRRRENETAHKLADKSGVGVGTIKRVMAVKHSGDSELYDKVRSGEMSANGAYTTMKEQERKAAAAEVKEGKATMHFESGVGKTVACDLLMTEVPSGTSPDDWMYAALSGVRPNGHAYVFVDSDPSTLHSYLDASYPLNVELTQVLVWSFDYILGNDDWSRYKPSWKAVLFFRGNEADDLRFPYIKERNAVHSVNAEGGNLGEREFELRMPSELAERFISQSTKEGDLVFDPFAKRGTILLAAKKLGRDSIGYEQDEGVAEVAFSNGVDRG